MMMPSMHTIIRVGATVGGMAVGYYAFSGSKRERMLQAVVGGAAGYLVSGAATKMMPATQAPPAASEQSAQ